ncbi:MAG: hypothetical protein K8R88_10830, partial [Armatimonadetes bacterium]|nr:hypothetical protein [Armatimonadota bacterium]
MVSPLMAIESGAAAKMGFRLESPCAVARDTGNPQFDFKVGETSVKVVFEGEKIEFSGSEEGEAPQSGSVSWNAITGVDQLAQTLATIPMTVKHGIMRTAS